MLTTQDAVIVVLSTTTVRVCDKCPDFTLTSVILFWPNFDQFYLFVPTCYYSWINAIIRELIITELIDYLFYLYKSLPTLKIKPAHSFAFLILHSNNFNWSYIYSFDICQYCIHSWLEKELLITIMTFGVSPTKYWNLRTVSYSLHCPILIQNFKL